MRKYVFILHLFAVACNSVAAEPPPAAVAAAAKSVYVEQPVTDPIALEDIAASKMSTVEKMSGMSAYTKWMLEQEAKGRPDWPRTKRQGCQLARMGISENASPLLASGLAGGLSEDHAGIASVVVNSAHLGGDWLSVMQVLAPHVGKLKAPNRPRQVWTSNLPCTGAAKPEGWDNDKYAGDWETSKLFWVKFRDEVTSKWLAKDFHAAPGRVIAWGCRPTKKNESWCHDEDFAKRRGLCKIENYGDLNSFWAKPGNGCEVADRPKAQTVSAKTAAGKK